LYFVCFNRFSTVTEDVVSLCVFRALHLKH
jgi:hypothetical protein